MPDLDSAAALELDSLGLLDVAGASAEAFDAARRAAEETEIGWPPEAIHTVAICGMGGSAAAGDLVLGAYRERLRRPAQVIRDYYVPGWVGENTLAILSSYSGTTEETLTCGMQALDYNAPAICITSGGKLRDFYAEREVPIVPVPPGLQPRAALLHMLVPLVIILGRMEIIPDASGELEEARETVAASVAAYGPEVPVAENPAKQLALALEGTMPVIWGAELTAPIAMRWKCQFNENAKVPSYWAALPELNHNEIVGMEGMGPVGPLTQILMLREERQHRQVHRRFDYTKELIEGEVNGVMNIVADGTAALARMLDLVMLGDYASIYLGLLQGRDPGPVDVIGKLKDRLASSGYGRTADPG